jgi:hypothetical protein
MKKSLILLLATILVSCSPTSPLNGEQSFISSPTALPSQTKVVSATEIPTALETSIPTETLTSSENFPLTYNLPEWIKDPEATIGMTISEIDGDSFRFAFLNLETKDSFEILASSNVVMGYFWIPDGTHFGFLSLDMQTIFLVNLEGGQVEQIPISEHAVRFLKGVEREKFIEPLIIQGIYPNDFTFLPLYHQDYSDDLRYIANYDFQNTAYNLLIVVEDVETQQVNHITNPSDGLCDMEYMWSPVKSELAILRSKFFDGCGMIGMPPGEKIDIYKPDGKKITSFEGSFANPTWSPDGHKILYGETSTNTPCILDISSGIKRCIREIPRKHPTANSISGFSWSMDGREIYYIYDNRNESGLCVYNLITGDDFCPTNDTKELKDFSVVRYETSSDERFFMFHFGGSCTTCDYWANPTVGVISKDGSIFYTLGEEAAVSIIIGNSSIMFSYPMVTLLWRPNPIAIP